MNTIFKTTLSFVTISSLAMGASNAELEAELKALKAEFKKFKAEQGATNEALVDEVTSTGTTDSQTDEPENLYEQFSDLGMAASKVYNTKDALSIGGYGEYRYKKYNDYKNSSSDAVNKILNRSQTNVVRFIPYIGYRFNDWIVMNTEIEFEDGGARSDNTKNYKYAIVEFSYIDFLLDPTYNLRVGHVLVPFGNINLNHEPTAFLTADRPLIENFIIPSTWHTNGALVYGEKDKFDYHVGLVTSPDAAKFTEGRFIQQGREGAKQYTDDLTAVARFQYNIQPGLDVGTSIAYGESTKKEDVTYTLAEAHVSYKNNGFDIQALAVMGQLGGDYKKLNSTENTLSGSVNGQYLTVGYNVLKGLKTSHKLYAVGEIERLDMDADSETTNVDNNRFNEYTVGLAYFPDPKVVVKGEYNLKDYASNAKLADEKAIQASLGFIF